VITPELLGRAFGDAPDPEMARVAFSRMGERREVREVLERPEVIPAAARLLGFSTAAADFFLAHPEELECLADVRPRALGELVPEASQSVVAFGPEAGLRRFRRRASYRVAARDLAGAPVDEVMVELSAIADTCLRVAASAVGEDELAIVAMGKLGGLELNYSSDVDVLFLHRSPGGEAQAAASASAAAVVSLLSHPTVDGIALRVDPNLRPQGRAGPLSRSLDAMVDYYARHAESWERQALLKARPVAGDLQLAAAFVDAVVPFVYPSTLPAATVGEIRATKARLEEHVRALGKDDVELKRGRGGIRDVEFAVQLLQLVHGRRHAALRRTGTLPALAGLAEEGFVSTVDAAALADSYRFLRRLEHRLQVVRDLQTHELPRERAALSSLARAMGLPTVERLLDEHARQTQTVRELHERLFYRPLLEAFAASSAPHPGVDRTATEELLAGLGFRDPAVAYEGFARLLDPATRSGKILTALFPVVAPQLALAPVPDAGLVRFSRVVDGLATGPGWADRWTEHPDTPRRLAALTAVSSVFADTLVAHPARVAALADVPSPGRPLFVGEPESDLVRIAGAYAAGDLKVPELGRRLAMVADWVVARAVEAARADLPIAVLAFGKLGGEEPTFASDLDLMFVYEGEGMDAFRSAGGAAERALAAIADSGWVADLDLRPEGRSGPPARSMASYLEYWERWAETWEYQTLLRARFVAGDESLGRRFLSTAADFAYPQRLTLGQVVAIRRMRVRMEEERVRPKDARRFHFKLGYGSLADVQFAVELSLMRRGFDHPEVRRTNTVEALEALAAAGLLEGSVARSLAEAHVFLSEIKNALEIERRVAAEALPASPEGQAVLARRLGYEAQARHRFLQDYRRITRRARLAMERVFYGDDPA